MKREVRNGFTLVELLVAALILYIGVMGISLSFNNGILYTTRVREVSIAVNAAQAEIEMLRNTAFSQIVSYSVPGSRLPTGLSNATISVLVDPYLYAGMKRITVTVRWRSYLGKSLQKSLATVVTEGGISGK